MKKILAIILSIITILSLVACGGEQVGNDNAVNSTLDPTHTHNYIEYKCTECGLVDAAHSYEYLARFVKENGTADGTDISVVCKEEDGLKCELKYSTEQDFLYATFTSLNDDITHFVELRLDTYQYTSTFGPMEMKGIIDAETFGRNSMLTYTDYTGPKSSESEMLNVTQSALLVLINGLDTYLLFNFKMIGTLVEDLGFKGM